MGAKIVSIGSKVGAAHLNYALCEEQRSFGLTVLPTYLLFLNVYQDHRLLRCDIMQSGTQHLLLLRRNFLLQHSHCGKYFFCKFFGFGSGRNEISVLGYDTCVLGLGYRSFEITLWLKLYKNTFGLRHEGNYLSLRFGNTVPSNLASYP